MSLLFKRGLASERAMITLQAGEPFFELDTGTLYIGDGATQGGVVAVQIPKSGTFSLSVGQSIYSIDISGFNLQNKPVGATFGIISPSAGSPEFTVQIIDDGGTTATALKIETSADPTVAGTVLSYSLIL